MYKVIYIFLITFLFLPFTLQAKDLKDYKDSNSRGICHDFYQLTEKDDKYIRMQLMYFNLPETDAYWHELINSIDCKNRKMISHGGIDGGYNIKNVELKQNIFRIYTEGISDGVIYRLRFDIEYIDDDKAYISKVYLDESSIKPISRIYTIKPDKYEVIKKEY